MTTGRRGLWLGVCLLVAILGTAREGAASCCGCIADAMHAPCPAGERICFDAVGSSDCGAVCQSFGCFGADWTAAATCGTSEFYTNCATLNPSTPTPSPRPTRTPEPRDCCQCSGCPPEEPGAPVNFCSQAGSASACDDQCAAESCTGAQFVAGARCNEQSNSCEAFTNSAAPAASPLVALLIGAGLLAVGIWSVRRALR